MEETRKCPKCGGRMLLGEECSHMWKNDSKKTFVGAGAARYYTYACEACGYMESYLEKKA